MRLKEIKTGLQVEHVRQAGAHLIQSNDDDSSPKVGVIISDTPVKARGATKAEMVECRFIINGKPKVEAIRFTRLKILSNAVPA
jgi:hypothetical protein